MKQRIKLTDIKVDAGTQVRAAINEDTVADYCEQYQSGSSFPDLDVFADGNKYLLADGFHRFMAASRAGLKEIDCQVHSGTRQDCLRFALGCNVRHGLRRTNADKRRSVELALAEWPKMSDREIAKVCAVSLQHVCNVRDSNCQNLTVDQPETRIGADGKERRLPTKLPSPPIVKPPHPIQASVPPSVKAKAAQRLDHTGYPIPDKLVALWDRAEEWQGVLSQVSVVRGIVRKAQEDKDITAAEINFSSLMGNLDQAYADLKTCKPHAVCPTCQGKGADHCRLCRGKGFISQYLWDTCVPQDLKDVRAKANKA